MNNPKPFHDATQAVVFLEVLAGIVAKSPVTYSASNAQVFADQLLSMAESEVCQGSGTVR
ncbi:hypothetical protein ACQQCD_13650 [Pseudarthrobacter sp. J1763]|uniref:hypothetical protein n=1 Tax=Pseudarthrobacter sp. J1763 TaxID=3420445 RepID=UPI003D296CA8